MRRREEVAPRLFTRGRKTSLTSRRLDQASGCPTSPQHAKPRHPFNFNTKHLSQEYHHFSFTDANSLIIFLATTSQRPNVPTSQFLAASLPQCPTERNTLMTSTMIHHLTCKAHNTHQIGTLTVFIVTRWFACEPR